jgi:hypothetical protein
MFWYTLYMISKVKIYFNSLDNLKIAYIYISIGFLYAWYCYPSLPLEIIYWASWWVLVFIVRIMTFLNIG